MHFAQVSGFFTVASLSRFLVAMDSDWEDDDVDIPVVVEDDTRSRGAPLSPVVAIVSSRAQSRSLIHSLLQAWKLLGYTPSLIKRTRLFQELLLIFVSFASTAFPGHCYYYRQ